MSLNTEDRQYIQSAISTNNRTLIDEFRKDSERYMGALKEGFENQVNMLAELIRERPTRSEVVNMINEQTRPIVRQETYKVIHEEFAPVISSMQIMLRSHEKRIGKLETFAQH